MLVLVGGLFVFIYRRSIRGPIYEGFKRGGKEITELAREGSSRTKKLIDEAEERAERLMKERELKEREKKAREQDEFVDAESVAVVAERD